MLIKKIYTQFTTEDTEKILKLTCHDAKRNDPVGFKKILIPL